MSTDSLLVGVIVTGVTVGMYLAVAVLIASAGASPFLSRPTGAVRDKVTPLAVPTNPGSGRKVTSPVARFNEYSPSPGTVIAVLSVT
ncbi:Uncharacterised protein [Streptococcus infantis]|nr:Uncharacterised protein [Streptococcus infantis]